MPASPSRNLLDPVPPTRLLRDLITRVEQLVVQHQGRELQGWLSTTLPSITVPDYSRCLVILTELARRSRSPNQDSIPSKRQEDLCHGLLSIEIEVGYVYEELEPTHLRTISKSTKQRSIEQSHTLRTTYRSRWLLQLETMLADCDRSLMASDERKTQE